jgi:2-C-methyl-D-erythritol 4-phosphate cytidylyltransferase
VVIWTMVLAAGRGTRFGSSPKQFEPLGERPLLSWSLEAARQVSDGVVLVVPDDDGPSVDEPGVVVVVGGATRSESVRCGLVAVPAEARVIVVHDAARPLAPVELFREVIDAVLGGADAAIPGLPVTDTIKAVDGDLVVETLDRDRLVAVQTPQAFAADVLRRAHAGEASATDDAALVEAAGGQVRIVPGSERALKVTTPDDLVRARALL